MGINEIIKVINQNKSFLVSSHINPEGDAIGSQLAMASLLAKLKKKVYMVDSDPVPEYFNFLPLAKEIMVSASKNIKFDVAMIVDCPTLSRIGKVTRLMKDKIVANIDHHISNSYFGSVNWVEPEASSCGEMIYELFKKMNCPLTKNEALYLYVSILTDTGSFSYENTRPSTHKIAAELLNYGICPADITSKLYQKNSMNAMRLMALALNTLKVEGSGKIAHITVTKDMFKKSGAEPVDTESFIDIAKSIEGVEVAVFFRQTIGSDAVHVSFRSKSDFDVNMVAAKFGGGGHYRASGCTIIGNLERAKKMVMKILKNEIGRKGL